MEILNTGYIETIFNPSGSCRPIGCCAPSGHITAMLGVRGRPQIVTRTFVTKCDEGGLGSVNVT